MKKTKTTDAETDEAGWVQERAMLINKMAAIQLKLNAALASKEGAEARAREVEKEMADLKAEKRRPIREHLPTERSGVVHKFSIRQPEGPPVKLYVNVSTYPDGRVGEVFLKVDKQGSLPSGALDAVAMAVSIGLQYGIPLSVYTSKFVGMQFEPRGPTGDPHYKYANSVLDLVGRFLRDKYDPPPPPITDETPTGTRVKP